MLRKAPCLTSVARMVCKFRLSIGVARRDKKEEFVVSYSRSNGPLLSLPPDENALITMVSLLSARKTPTFFPMKHPLT